MQSKRPECNLGDIFPIEQNPKLGALIARLDKLPLPFDDRLVLLSSLVWERIGSFEITARILASTPGEVSHRLDILYGNEQLLDLYDKVSKKDNTRNGQELPAKQKLIRGPKPPGKKKKSPKPKKIPTINRIMDYLIHAQSGFIRSLDPAQRRDINYTDIGKALGIHPSTVLKQLKRISTVNIQGKEIPVSQLLRNAVPVKSKLQELLNKNPRMTDREAGNLLRDCFGFSISRRTVTKYRLGLGIGHSKVRGFTN